MAQEFRKRVTQAIDIQFFVRNRYFDEYQRAKALTGILNGMDRYWASSTISKRYSSQLSTLLTDWILTRYVIIPKKNVKKLMNAN